MAWPPAGGGHGSLERFCRLASRRPALVRSAAHSGPSPARAGVRAGSISWSPGFATAGSQTVALTIGRSRGAHAASTTSARTAVAHSTSSRSYSRRPSGDSTAPDRAQSARMSSFTASGERTGVAGEGRRGIRKEYGAGPTTAPAECRPIRHGAPTVGAGRSGTKPPGPEGIVTQRRPPTTDRRARASSPAAGWRDRSGRPPSVPRVLFRTHRCISVNSARVSQKCSCVRVPLGHNASTGGCGDLCVTPRNWRFRGTT